MWWRTSVKVCSGARAANRSPRVRRRAVRVPRRRPCDTTYVVMYISHVSCDLSRLVSLTLHDIFDRGDIHHSTLSLTYWYSSFRGSSGSAHLSFDSCPISHNLTSREHALHAEACVWTTTSWTSCSCITSSARAVAACRTCQRASLCTNPRRSL